MVDKNHIIRDRTNDPIELSPVMEMDSDHMVMNPYGIKGTIFDVNKRIMYTHIGEGTYRECRIN
jgi:hypothetical protein